MKGKLKIVFISAVLLLTSCQSDQVPMKSESNILNVALDAEVSSLDAQAAIDSTSFDVIGTLMEGLYRLDDKNRPALAMAEQVEQSLDGQVYTFKLKAAHWSDGTSVQADDFVFGWQYAADPAAGHENGFLLSIAGVKNAAAVRQGELPVTALGIRAIDEQTLEVTLERPVSYFESMLTLPTFFPLSRSFYESCQGQYGLSPDQILANGPFKLTGYEPAATMIVVQKNEYYWDQQAVQLGGIVFHVMKESQQVLMAYTNGELDLAVIAGEQADQFRERTDFQTVSLGSLWYLSLNQKVAGLHHKSLRLALAAAFDKNAIVNRIMKDGSTDAMFAVPAGVAVDAEGIDFRETAPEPMLVKKELAATYWNQAKKTLEIDQLTLTLLIEDTEFALNIGQFLQAEIQNNLPGVTIRLEQVPKKNRLARMKAGDYQLALTRWGADYADPTAFLGMWTTNSPYNYGSWSNETYDQLLYESLYGSLAGDLKERWLVLQQAETMILEEQVIIPICQKANAVLMNPQVQGMEFHPVGINRIFRNVTKEGR